MLKVINLKKNYDSLVQNDVLNNINISIQNGDFVLLLGQSGSGKTTLLNLISGLDSKFDGEIIFNNKKYKQLKKEELRKLRFKNFSYIFQEYSLLENLTAFENVDLIKKLSNSDKCIDEIMKKLEIFECRDKYPYELSGGQRQRIAIARALIKDPKILFCDEPTGALDYQNGINVMQILQELNKDTNLTIVLVTHNEEYINYASKVIRLKSGKIYE